MPSKYPSARFQHLKSEVPITEVLKLISDKHVPWDGMVCCPLHDDRTPSMKVYSAENRCHCFGACGKSFDAISLYAISQDIKPSEALEDLERIFKVVWDGSEVEIEESEEDLSAWPRLEAELVRQCQTQELTVRQRISKRCIYWEARHDGHNNNKLSEAVGLERAREIIEQWRAENAC